MTNFNFTNDKQKKKYINTVKYFPVIRLATLKSTIPFIGKCVEKGSHYTPSVGIYSGMCFIKSY